MCTLLDSKIRSGWGLESLRFSHEVVLIWVIMNSGAILELSIPFPLEIPARGFFKQYARTAQGKLMGGLHRIKNMRDGASIHYYTVTTMRIHFSIHYSGPLSLELRDRQRHHHAVQSGQMDSLGQCALHLSHA